MPRGACVFAGAKNGFCALRREPRVQNLVRRFPLNMSSSSNPESPLEIKLIKGVHFVRNGASDARQNNATYPINTITYQISYCKMYLILYPVCIPVLKLSGC